MVPVTVHLPQSVVAALGHLAAKQDRTRSNLVLRYIRAGLGADGVKLAESHASPQDRRGARVG